MFHRAVVRVSITTLYRMVQPFISRYGVVVTTKEILLVLVLRNQVPESVLYVLNIFYLYFIKLQTIQSTTLYFDNINLLLKSMMKHRTTIQLATFSCREQDVGAHSTTAPHLVQCR